MELSSDLGKRIDDGEAERELQEDGGKTCALGLFLQPVLGKGNQPFLWETMHKGTWICAQTMNWFARISSR